MSQARHRKPSPLPAIIYSTLLSMALAGVATVGVTSAIGFSRPDNQTSPPHSLTVSSRQSASTVQFVHPPAVARAVNFSSRQSVRVRSGQTLSSIAGNVLGSSSRWPILWWDNRSKIGNPNVLLVGTRIRFGTWTKVKPWLRKRAMAAAGAIMRVSPATGSSGPPALVSAPSPSQPMVQAPQSGFQACVIARESGGNPQIWNPSGHWGLYQFSASTWSGIVSMMGLSARQLRSYVFGSASASAQNSVFAYTMANPASTGGAGNWAPYDGC